MRAFLKEHGAIYIDMRSGGWMGGAEGVTISQLNELAMMLCEKNGLTSLYPKWYIHELQR